MKTFIYCTLIVLAMALIGFALPGCAHQAVAVHPATQPVFVHPGGVPNGLQHFARSLDVLAFLAVIGVGVFVGLYFVPATHAISGKFAVIAAGIEASALVTRTSLWLVPWIAVALAVAAVLAFIYEVYEHRLQVEGLIEEVKASTGSTGTEVKQEATSIVGKVETAVESAVSYVENLVIPKPKMDTMIPVPPKPAAPVITKVAPVQTTATNLHPA